MPTASNTAAAIRPHFRSKRIGIEIS